jgi:glycosyltransferase involved in cell wall biosynthesis
MSTSTLPELTIAGKPETKPHENDGRPATRIAYLVNQYPQPSQSFIRREIRALEDSGYAVERFTVRRYDGPLVDEQDLAERERTTALLDAGAFGLLVGTAMTFCARPRRFVKSLALAVRLGRRSDRGLMRHLIYFVEACALLRLLARKGVDHVHAHFGTNSATTALFCRLLGGPSYSFTVHGPEEFDKPEFLHLGTKIEHAAFVVAVSDFGQSQLFRTCSYEQWSKMHVVHCGVDASFHDVAPTPPPDAPRLTCVARLHEQKGLPMLVDAVALLRKSGVPVQVTIVGDGPLRGLLERRIEDLGLKDAIRLAGWMSNAEVRRELLASRALVLPSFAEGLPVVIMESLALHRPVISTYVAGIPELVEQDVCGKLVPAGAVEPLAVAMCEILEASVDELAALGAEGARRVRRRHCAATEAAKLAALIERTVAESYTV